MKDNSLSKKEIFDRCEWVENDFAMLTLSSPALGSVSIKIATNMSRAISDRSAMIVNHILNLDGDALSQVKHHLWESCQECCEDSNYGAEVKPGQTEKEANLQMFGVFNPDDALKKSHLKYVYISEEDEDLKGNYGQLTFDNEWNSHLDVVVMKNGAIVGRGDSGLWLGEFEDDVQPK